MRYSRQSNDKTNTQFIMQGDILRQRVQYG